ncbi:hypothetical protein BCR33DRAFT_741675 [Rhizoclosmatium globosum]|uniref:Centrosomin N-terminal motif 1 domain-containing protein n=1 Tax=Rhizoclosmatium globosum TaxID=329046 RepID=A0A1Y2BTR4_9FUNG|nr:hypothetical protein BCR33DRAFT_741675 [Rhizoclosmatium globosum]|eukprot:ORY38139.1 hypothetical protein BCR33DRAFT_741675 [Rhizoclosmatium globosum]
MFSKQTTTLLREDFHDDSSFVDSPSRSRHRSRGREDSESADAQFHDASDEVLTGAPVAVAVTDGLGIKERDKILDDLRKENFNLKLRIFFLEERLESWCIDGDGEMHSFKADAEQAKDMEIELNSIANASDSKIDPNIPKLKGVAAVKSRIQDLLNSKKSLESKVSLISAENDTLQRQLQSTKQSLEVAELNFTSAQQHRGAKQVSKAAEEILELKGAKSGLESALKESSHAQDRLLTKLETSARELEGLKMKLRFSSQKLKTVLQNLNHKAQSILKRLKTLTTLQTTHHHVQSAHEQELADLHDHFSRLAQEKATQLEELIQARQKSKSPTLELMKLRAEHSTEIELYRQQLADFERLSEIAATEMGLLKNELEHRRGNSGKSRNAGGARRLRVRLLFNVRRRMSSGLYVNVKTVENVGGGETVYEGWGTGVDTEVGRLRGELEVRVVMHEEAQRKFGEENGRLVEEKNEVEKDWRGLSVIGLQEARNEQASQGNDHAEALKDILIWINTVLGLPEVSNSYTSVTVRRNYKKATLLQKKLKSALEQTNKSFPLLNLTRYSDADLDSLRNHLFAVKNELLVSKTEIEDMRGDLERKDTQVRELNIALMDTTSDIKEELKAEKEYSEKVEAQFQRLEEMEKESRREIESLEHELREADAREAMLKEKVRMGESLNKECTGLEHEIAEIQKQRHNEQKALDSKIRELEEELNVTRRQLEITEKHVQNLKETKLTSPLTPGFDDPASLVSANDRLRADYFHSRRLVEEKEQSLQELRNQFTEVIHKLRIHG